MPAIRIAAFRCFSFWTPTSPGGRAGRNLGAGELAPGQVDATRARVAGRGGRRRPRGAPRGQLPRGVHSRRGASPAVETPIDYNATCLFETASSPKSGRSLAGASRANRRADRSQTGNAALPLDPAPSRVLLRGQRSSPSRLGGAIEIAPKQ
eukprot:3064070-Pyramimonas_sp.AAC.1